MAKNTIEKFQNRIHYNIIKISVLIKTNKQSEKEIVFLL